MFLFNIQTPRKKSPVDEKVSHKDNNTTQKATRKSSASAPSEDADKAVKKHPPTVKRTSGVSSNSNVTNLVKIPPNSKNQTDPSTSWISLRQPYHSQELPSTKFSWHLPKH
jgi:cytoskeletal protein RodZ